MVGNLDCDYEQIAKLDTIHDALWSGGREFHYDDLNRLTQASGNFGPNLMEVTQGYTYDAIGNVLSKAGLFYYYCNHPLQPAAPQYCTGREADRFPTTRINGL